ncbi:Mu transposase C-terminal domain-containing protein [Rhodanobacter ginsengisoli]|uniref:Mu transposase C-terminal domain-containing protein n=1 Tax=Rhodanobacter ginsengisoli TaxID=418646 RepID=A0ABW0QRR2_9GAMM
MSTKALFAEGRPVAWNGHSGEVVENPDTSPDVLIRLAGEKAIRTVPRSDLTPLEPLDEIDRGLPLAAIDADKWERAAEKADACRAIEGACAKTKAVAMAAQSLGVDERTVWRIRREYQTEPKVSALLAQKPGRRKGSRYLGVQREALLHEAIEKAYLTRERPSLRVAMDHLELECAKQGLVCPCEKTVRNRLNAIAPEYVVQRRHGAKRAREKFKPVPGTLLAMRPMELIEIDHTLADILLVSDDTRRMVIGRPWVTFAISVSTRCIVGFHISFEAPTSSSLAMCILSIVLPKDQLARYLDFDLLGVDWPCSGKIEAILTDNGHDFHGIAVKRGCQEHGIELRYRPVGSPHWGGIIERLIGTMMGRLRMLPGATQRDVRAKDGQDVEGRACLTLSEFRQWMVTEITAHYHQVVHRGIGMPPIEAWRSKSSPETSPACELSDQQCMRLFVDFLPYCERPISRVGINMHGMRYWSDELRDYVAKGAKHAIRYDSRDIRRVYFVNPFGQVIIVNCVRPDVPQMSVVEWQKLSSAQRTTGSIQQRIDDRIAGHDANKALVATSQKATRQAHRASHKKVERDKNVQALPMRQVATEPAAPVTTFSPNRVPTPFDIMEF